VPTVRHSRTLPVAAERLWEVIGDPHHLPRWWPRVHRVEGVDADAFTEVLVSEKGKMVRADFRLVEERPERKIVWAQQIDGSPFARVLKSAETEIALLPIEPTLPGVRPASAAGAMVTEVTIELRQVMRGLEWGGSRTGWGHRWTLGVLPRSGAFLVRRAASATIEEALDGLERIFGP
jgi:uncharacterized protein YndB with AHSA1/START domain